MAINYTALGFLDKAIGMYQDAIRFYEKNQSPNALAYAVKEVGSLFFRLGDYPVAKEYFKRALSITQNTSDTIGMQETYQRLGQVENFLNNLDQALQYYEAAALLNAKLKDSSTLSKILSGKGNVLQKQHKYPLALANFRQALQMDRHFNQEPLIITDLIVISRLFLQLNQLDSAGYYAELARNLALKSSLEHQKLIEELQAQISEQKGDFAQALSHYKRFFALHDKIYSVNAQEKLKQEQVRQNIEDYQKEKEQAERETALLNVQNRLYLLLSLAFMAIILIGGYLLMRLRSAQKLLKAQNLQLQELNRTKDKFFGIIAHDIRSPMVALEGVGEQMAHYLKKQNIEKLERLSERVDKTARQLSSLLDNLLNWALLQQGIIPYRPQALNIHQISTEVLAMFEASAQAKNIQLENHITADIIVQADVNTLQTILRNLLSNAIKFTPLGGKVSLSAEEKEGKAFLHIQDTGTGIAAEKLEKLFSIDKSSEKGTAGEKGTGLGLMLVQELVELNKGQVKVRSKLDEGSSFTVSLPLVVNQDSI
jgi:signal transduction histidine kinase